MALAWLRFSLPSLRRIHHSLQTRARICPYSSLSIIREGKNLQLTAAEGANNDKVIYNGIWLRHNCRCSKCYNTSSSMNTVHHLELSDDIKIDCAELKDDIVKIKWSSKSVGIHEGEFPLQWLLKNNHKTIAENREDTTPLITTSIPTIDFSELLNSDEGTYQWLKYLNYYGICLITNAGTHYNQLKKIGTKFPHIQRTIFDISPKTFSSLAQHLTENVKSDLAYSKDPLLYHQDLTYMESPPGILLLHCVRRDSCVEGGTNEYVDLYAVASKLKENNSDLFDVLTQVPVTFTKINYTKSDYEYHSNLTTTRPHIQLNRYGEITAINWNGNHQQPIQFESEELLEQYYKAFIAFSKLFEELKSGEIMTLNNRRFIHNRDGFKLNGGVRHLNSMYFNIDYLRSQFLVLGRALNKNEPSKNVLAITL